MHGDSGLVGRPNGMRLCRFSLDEMPLTGFFADDRVIPIDQAAEAYCEDKGVELLIPSTEDLLDLLPPDGSCVTAVRELWNWVRSRDEASLAELAIDVSEVQLLVPIGEPKKLLLLAGNYTDHIAERGGLSVEREATFPYVFMKPATTTLTNPGDPIVIPQVSPDQIDWECELGVIIGRTCRNVEEADALAYVAGYTVVNDISDRKFTPNPDRKPRERDKFFDWQHGKWHDTFCPMGPCIATVDSINDPQDLEIELSVNGQTKQKSSTSKMIFPVAAIVSFLSRFVTLEPGDIISTGTPSGVGSSTNTFLRPGDSVNATISGIGMLENPVVMESD